MEQGEILQGKPGSGRFAGSLCVVYLDSAASSGSVMVYRPFWDGRQVVETVDKKDYTRIGAKVRYLYIEGLLTLEDQVEEFANADEEEAAAAAAAVGQNRD
jgi:hypothetical protein